MNVDAVLGDLTAQMSIDGEIDAHRADAPGADRVEMPPPTPLQKGEQMSGEGGMEGAGGAQLARLHKDKVNRVGGEGGG